MNQRIRELHSQCKVCDKDTVLYFDYEKFAELIVRECIREFEISRKCDPYTGELFDCEYNTCIKEQSVMLKEHFGVKK